MVQIGYSGEKSPIFPRPQRAERSAIQIEGEVIALRCSLVKAKVAFANAMRQFDAIEGRASFRNRLNPSITITRDLHE